MILFIHLHTKTQPKASGLVFVLVSIFAELQFEPRASLTGPCSHPDDVLTWRAGRAFLGLHWTGHGVSSPFPHKRFLFAQARED